jgi:hypothetical protein
MPFHCGPSFSPATQSRIIRSRRTFLHLAIHNSGGAISVMVSYSSLSGAAAGGTIEAC